MRVAALQIFLGTVLVAALAAGGALIGPAVPVALPPLSAAVTAAAETTSRQRLPLDSLALAAAGRAPFRASRTPSAVAYDPSGLVPIASAAPPAPRPVLAVSGIVWGVGAKSSAVVEGLPGTQGPRVVRIGEIIGGLKVRRIQRDTVVVVGSDTIWTLGVRAPWK